MTNAEKFKEVFGFEVNKPTVNYGMHCPHGRKDMNDRAVECVACNRDCISDFWQSEYKEPKKEEIHYGISRGAKEQIGKSMNTFRGLM